MKPTLARSFRKYHRWLAPILALPLLLTVITGILYPLVREWNLPGLSARFLLQLHSGEIFGLEAFYPILNGLGLLGLLVTGITLTPLFHHRQKPPGGHAQPK